MVAKSCHENDSLGSLPCGGNDEVHSLVMFYAKSATASAWLVRLQTYKEMTIRGYDIAKCFSHTEDVRVNKSGTKVTP